MTIRSLAQNQAAFWNVGIVDAPGPQTPAQAGGYGNLVFFDDFNSLSTIDIGNSQVPGFKWYIAKWFTGGTQAYLPGGFTIANSILTVVGSDAPTLTTAFDTGVTDAFTGTVFGTGGCFEASLRFNPALNGGTGGPNFFGMSIEHIADNGSVSLGRWPGQVSGYAHFMEVDFFEPLGSTVTAYNAALHDWGGVFSGGTYPQNITNGVTNVVQTGLIDFTKFHTYSTTWVPQNGATPGKLLRFFDGVLVQSNYYLGPVGSPPLPGSGGVGWSPSTPGDADRTYSIIDSNRLTLALGGGSTWPMDVDWVRVWK